MYCFHIFLGLLKRVRSSPTPGLCSFIPFVSEDGYWTPQRPSALRPAKNVQFAADEHVSFDKDASAATISSSSKDSNADPNEWECASELKPTNLDYNHEYGEEYYEGWDNQDWIEENFLSAKCRDAPDPLSDELQEKHDALEAWATAQGMSMKDYSIHIVFKTLNISQRRAIIPT